MSSTTLKSIKRESVNAIFSVIANAEVTSRADIASSTGLSLVTVGKVVDALLERNILRQEKEVRSAAGRRAGMLTLNAQRFSIIFDLSSRNFRLSIVDLRLQLVEKLQYHYKADLFYEENLRSFLWETVAYLKKRYDMKNCFGVGVCTPGPYNAETDFADYARIPELKDVPLHRIISEYLPHRILYIDAGENMAALSNISSLTDYERKTLIYLFLSEEAASGAIMVRGEFLHGYKRQTCDFGKMLLPGGAQLLTALRSCKTTDEWLSLLHPLLHIMIQILAPDAILLECEPIHKDEGTILPKLRETLCLRYGYMPDALPELIGTYCKFSHAHRGLAQTLRAMWLDTYVIQADAELLK